MAAINGTVKWGKLPLWFSTNYFHDQQQNFNGNYLVSAGLPMEYQAVWTSTGVTDQYTPSASGDIVNCIFNVETTTDSTTEWTTVAKISKTRDLAVIDSVGSSVPQLQTFTIDVSSVIQDELSYSLTPLGMGSYQTVKWGGMNGGRVKQDNITSNVSPYTPTRNGAYRTVRVWCEFEILNSVGEIELASTTLTGASIVRAINSVPPTDNNPYYNQMRTVQRWSADQQSPKLAMTNCPNYGVTTTQTPSLYKPVGINEHSEFLYFYIKDTYDGSYPDDNYNLYEAYGQAYNKNGSTGLSFVLGSLWTNKNGVEEITSDISHDFNKHATIASHFAHSQSVVSSQNVAPAYINSHAYAPQHANYPYTTAITPITANTDTYRIYLRGVFYNDYVIPASWTSQRHTSVYWYKVTDGESQGPFEKVRFHWLNRAGGIDSYTANKNVMQGLQVSKNIIEKELPDRKYHQSKTESNGTTPHTTGSYYDNSMRGFNTYRGGSEVINLNASNTKSVYTEPLPYLEAKWLEELFTSPNVWIEVNAEDSYGQDYEHDQAFHMNQLNPFQRPVKAYYLPVIITNTEVTSVNEEQRTTTYNIEYTESQEILTQRN